MWWISIHPILQVIKFVRPQRYSQDNCFRQNRRILSIGKIHKKEQVKDNISATNGSSGLPFNSCMCQSNTCIDEILINKIRWEDLQPINTTLRDTFSYEKPSISMDPPCHRFDTQDWIIRLRGNSILNPVKEFPGCSRLLLAQMLYVALKLCWR